MMEKRIWQVLGFWSMGLLLFMATVILIRWVVEFVSWSTLDSGWAQAIGSIAALGIAIFVMSRQNRHSAKLLVDADMLAYRRRTAGVKAMVDRAVTMAANAGSIVTRVITAEAEDLSAVTVDLTAVTMAMGDIVNVVKAIPTYELGSYDMANAIHLLSTNLENLSRMLRMLSEQPKLRGEDITVQAFMACLTGIQNCKAQFDRGAAEFSC